MRNASSAWASVFLAAVCVLLAVVAWIGWQNLLRPAEIIVSPGTPLSGFDEEVRFVEWQTPEKIANFSFLKEAENELEVATYRVGAVKYGTYAGWNLDDVFVCHCSGAGASRDTLLRVLSKVGEKPVVVSNFSSVLRYAEYDADAVDFVVSDIPGLTPPSVIRAGDIRLLRSVASTEGGFQPFSAPSYPPIFVDDELGDVYGVPGTETFYAAGKDGIRLAYELPTDWIVRTAGFAYVPQMTWTDGSENEDDYQFDSPDVIPSLRTCRLGSEYVAAADAATSPELEQAGTTVTGEPIYVLKNDDDPILLAIQARFETLADIPGWNSDETYSKRWVIYWKDSFNRLTRLIHPAWQDFCGG